ncbi:MAG: mannitol dehydrogenase family protein, partial [Flavimaricola sp.]|nr:mannitol dehydrogenase family protein [Flavimaricola sp.]
MPADRLTRSDAARPGVVIVHLGLGAFFRGFGAVYVADAMAASGGDWGIVGVSLKSAATRDALAPQGFAYQVVSMQPEGETPRIIEVLEDVRVAPEDPEGLLALMAKPAIRIVSLTVTEKGYCHEPSTGRLMFDHPDIVHDLTAPLPVSAPGFLVRALERRWLAGVPPFTVLICDNLPENGKMLRGVVLDLARRIDPALADWIAAEGRFPSTMVDRITPATTTADIDRLAKATGHFDAAPVFCEPFRQWVVEDDFVGGIRPDLAAAGVEMVPDVTPYEHMKLKMLNGTHSALAYLGYLGGHETISDTVADPVFAAYVRSLWADEIAPAVDAPEGVSLTDYATALFDRYANPAIRHRTWQIAMDGSQKLPQRLLGTLEANFAAGRPSPGLCLAVAAWMRYVGG